MLISNLAAYLLFSELRQLAVEACWCLGILEQDVRVVGIERASIAGGRLDLGFIECHIRVCCSASMLIWHLNPVVSLLFQLLDKILSKPSAVDELKQISLMRKRLL